MTDMIRSRWWSTDELAALPAPPCVARWNSISLQIDDCDPMRITDDFKAFIDEVQEEGLRLDVYFAKNEDDIVGSD